MSGSDIVVVLLLVGLVALVALYVGRPLVTGAGDAPPADPRAVALLAEREAVLANLRDLDADHAAGRLPDASWQAMRAETLARASATLAALDQIEAVSAGETARWAAEIEADVMAARATSPGPRRPVCPSCGAPTRAGDRFCPACGVGLDGVAELPA